MQKTVVLHIDNDPEFRRIVKYLLEKAGFKVVSSRDSVDAKRFQVGHDYTKVVLDSAGFDFAKARQKHHRHLPVIVLSSQPDSADFDADKRISKSDFDWRTKILEYLGPSMQERSEAAFERDLNKLLKTHYRQWVAYHGDKQIGFSDTETELYEKCRELGLDDDEFIVRSVEPLMTDEEIEFPAEC